LHCHIGVPELKQLVNSQKVVTDSSLGAKPIRRLVRHCKI
jgi:hypothetical protein